jgi:hypothetical protein
MKVIGVGAPEIVRIRFAACELDLLVDVLREQRARATLDAAETYGRVARDDTRSVDDRHDRLRALEAMLMRLEAAPPDDGGDARALRPGRPRPRRRMIPAPSTINARARATAEVEAAEVLQLLIRYSEAIGRQCVIAGRDLGLNRTQAAVMAALRTREPVGLSVLGDRLALRRPGISLLAQRLERRDVIRRHRHPHDHRQVLLAPARTPGRDCANALSAPSRPTRRMRMIVVGSTPHCSAAWRCVNSPVNSCCQIWYFSCALSGRLSRPLRLASCGPDMFLLGPV